MAKLVVLTGKLSELKDLVVEYSTRIIPANLQENEFTREASRVLGQLLAVSEEYAGKAGAALRDILPDDFEEPIFNFIGFLLNNPVIPVTIVGGYTAYTLVTNFFKNLAGFAGFIEPYAAYDRLQEG